MIHPLLESTATKLSIAPHESKPRKAFCGGFLPFAGWKKALKNYIKGKNKEQIDAGLWNRIKHNRLISKYAARCQRSPGPSWGNKVLPRGNRHSPTFHPFFLRRDITARFSFLLQQCEIYIVNPANRDREELLSGNCGWSEENQS